MASSLIAFVIFQAPGRPKKIDGEAPEEAVDKLQLWVSASATFGMIAIIFGGFRSGFATATEISAFAVVYAVVVGGLAFREFTVKSFLDLFKSSGARAGMVLFIIGMSQTVAYVLTLERIPHELGEAMARLSTTVGNWAFSCNYGDSAFN